MIMANDEGVGQSRIITPGSFGDAFALKEGREIFIVEMPECRFNKVPVCLASHSQINVPLMVNMRSSFLKMWKAMFDAMEKGIIQRP